MIVVLERGCTEEQIATVLSELELSGLTGRVLNSREKPLIHVTSGDTRRARALLGIEWVEGLAPTSGPRVRLEGRRFYPYHFIRWSAAGIFILGLLVFLAGQFPPGIGADVDPRNAPEDLAFPWYVAPVEKLVGLFPESLAWLGWLTFWGLAAVLLFLPVLDRTRGRSLRERWYVVAIGLALLGVTIALAFGEVGR